MSGFAVARLACGPIGGRFWQVKIAVQSLANGVDYYGVIWITTDTMQQPIVFCQSFVMSANWPGCKHCSQPRFHGEFHHRVVEWSVKPGLQ